MKMFISEKGKSIFILGVVVSLAAFFRFWQLTSYPPGFSADEATIGYNAYSILKTGRDEYGNVLPLAFKAFSDYQAPIYTYLTIPFVALLGLNELAVRLPSAVFGVGTIIIVYLLITRIYKNSTLGLFAAFFLTISPWQTFFSRGAWQTNLATFFITLGFYFFILGVERGKYLPLSVVAFLASLYSYQSPRLIVPIIGIFLILFYKKQLLTKRRSLLISGLIGLTFIIPMIFILVGPAGQARFKGVSIFSDPGPVNRINQRRGEHFYSQGVFAKVFHNKLQTFTIITAKNHLEHFGPSFLLIAGDPIGRHNVPEMGQVYLFDFVLLPLGFFFAIKKTNIDKSKAILFWLIVAPLASALTFQSPNALRAANMAVPLSIVSGFGAFWLFGFFASFGKYTKLAAAGLAGIILCLSVTRYLHQYYVHLPQRHSLEWEYGFKEVVDFIQKNQDNFSKVIITNRYDQPYIVALFYLGYDPKTYQEAVKQQTAIDEFGFTTITAFGKYEFRKINWDRDSKLENVLLIGTGEEIPSNALIVKEILFPNGKSAFKIVGT